MNAATMPKVGTPETYTPKSVVKLSFGNQSVYRNATVSFTDYYPALLDCVIGAKSVCA